MKFFVIPSICFSLFFTACSSKKVEPTTPSTLSIGNFSHPPKEINTDITTALNQLNQLMATVTGDRNPDGTMKQENTIPLVQQLLGMMQKFPTDEKVKEASFTVADILSITNDHENAARLFKLIFITYPTNQKVAVAQLQLARILNEDLGKKEEAIAIYRDFIKKFPNHPLVGTAETSLYELTR